MKTKALISFAVTAKLICVFVLAKTKSRFSHDGAHIKSELSTKETVHFYGIGCSAVIILNMSLPIVQTCVTLVLEKPDLDLKTQIKLLTWVYSVCYSICLFWKHFFSVESVGLNNRSRVVRKPTFCICENKDADQLCGNRKADQRLGFRYTDSTIPLLFKSEISSL